MAALVQVTEEDPGTNCWYGGQKIETGGDDDQDGVLDPSEVDFTQYACNGAPGSNGSNDPNDPNWTSSTVGAGCACGVEGGPASSGTIPGLALLALVVVLVLRRRS